MLTRGERHLHRLIDEYVTYFNYARLHQGFGQKIPIPLKEDICRIGGSDHQIVSCRVLGGLHHGYRQALAGRISIYGLP